ncbi:MAG: hypothetical protein QXN83_04715 [Nitrososphaerales archaeon]
MAELHDHDGLCCICKMGKDIDESRGIKVAESVDKAVRKITGLQKEASVIVKGKNDE